MTPNRSRQLRKLLIEIARRKQHAGTGSLPAFLRERTTQMVWLDLTSILSPIRWAVIGAVAARLYMPERLTHDLDIVIEAMDGPQARRKLLAAGFTYQGELSIGGSSWMMSDGKWMDMLEGDNAWWADAIAEAQTNRDGQGLPVIPLRYLTLMKFQAGRVQDIADVTRILGQASASTLNAVRTLFAEYAPEDVDDLESLIELGRLELQSVI